MRSERGWRAGRGSARSALAMGVFLVVAALSGCGSDEVERIPLPGDDVLATMSGTLPLAFVMEHLPAGGIAPSAEIPETGLVHGYLVDPYLHDGDRIQIVWLHDPAVEFPAVADFRTQVNPLVFVNDVLDGYGWEHLDTRTAEWSIIDRSKSAALPLPSEEDFNSSADQAEASASEGSDDGGESASEEGDDEETFSF